MTDLTLSIIILAAYIIGCLAVKMRLDHLAHRRHTRSQLRLINRYHAALDKHSNVVELDTYSRKVS